MEILQIINDYDIEFIYDAWKPINFSEGDYVIIQGDFGYYFYILKEGKAHAEKIFIEGQST